MPKPTPAGSKTEERDIPEIRRVLRGVADDLYEIAFSGFDIGGAWSADAEIIAKANIKIVEAIALLKTVRTAGEIGEGR